MRAQDFMREAFAVTRDKVEVNSLADISMGDYVMFKDDSDDQTIIGLPGQVRNIRNDKLDIYIGSSLRTGVDVSEIVKLVAK